MTPPRPSTAEPLSRTTEAVAVSGATRLRCEFDVRAHGTADATLGIVVEISDDGGETWRPFMAATREGGPALGRDGRPLAVGHVTGGRMISKDGRALRPRPFEAGTVARAVVTGAPCVPVRLLSGHLLGAHFIALGTSPWQ